MTRRASRELVDLLGAFLRRNAPALSDEDIQVHMESIAEGRAKTPDSARPYVLSEAASPRAGKPVAFPADALAAADLQPHDVRERLAQLTAYVAAQVQAGELPRIDLPDLHRANGIFDARGNVFLGHNVRRLALDERGGEAFMRYC